MEKIITIINLLQKYSIQIVNLNVHILQMYTSLFGLAAVTN